MSEILTKEQALGLLLEEIIENIRCINNEIASIKGDYSTGVLWLEKNTKLLELSLPIVSAIKYDIKTDFVYDNGKLEMK
ncbi:TPA: hypothetical protein NNQ18_004585 [Salmonella enterica]|nr:hypothetical protein [Salmonella enterica]